MSRTQFTTAVAAVALAVAALTACSPSYPPGPAGKITGREATYHNKTGGWFFMLTVGDGEPFRVTYDEYQHCVRGSAYPACAGR